MFYSTTEQHAALHYMHCYHLMQSSMLLYGNLHHASSVKFSVFSRNSSASIGRVGYNFHFLRTCGTSFDISPQKSGISDNEWNKLRWFGTIFKFFLWFQRFGGNLDPKFPVNITKHRFLNTNMYFWKLSVSKFSEIKIALHNIRI